MEAPQRWLKVLKSVWPPSLVREFRRVDGGAARGGFEFKRRRVVVGCVVLVGLVGVGAVGYGLGRLTLRTTSKAPVVAAPTTVVARVGTLIDERLMTANVEWARSGSLLNRLGGTVTSSSVEDAGAAFRLEAGVVFYAVDELPVVALPGLVPAYRTMTPGMVGSDVRQLQEFLSLKGYGVGTVDGRWGASTTAAYRKWRADSSLPVRVSVALGEIVFVPSLPVVTAASAGLTVGALIRDGDPILEVLAAMPIIRLALVADGTLQVPVGTAIDLDIDGTKVATIATARQSQSDSGRRLVELELTDSIAACGSWCVAIPTNEVSSWPATVKLKGPATGVIVPVGAIRSGAGSGSVVVLADGSSRPVDVVLVVGGDVVVTGIEEGDVIALPGTGG